MEFMPFALLGVGTVFYRVNDSKTPLMKTEDNKAVFLASVYEGNVLRKRGSMTSFSTDTCVQVAPATDEVTISTFRIDPVDPRRRFWAEGDVVRVGSERQAEIKVFEGLFVYSGFGTGRYYAKADNEIFGMQVDKARDKAEEEGVPFVQIDGMHWTSNQVVAEERERVLRLMQSEATAQA